MDSQDLVAYLAQKGFKVRSVSMVDSLTNTLEKRPAETSKNLPIIHTPISKGITGMPKCRQCFKSFANNIALRNHAKIAHFETIDDELLKLDANLGDETLDGDQMESSMPVGSQYQVVDSSFIGDSTGVETAEEISYVIIKTPSLSNVSYSGPNRKARKVETRPRKPYESRIKHDMKDVKVVEFGGPFRCVQCEDTFNECCEYSQHFHSMHSKRRRLTRCQICEKRFDHDLDVTRLAALSGGDGEVTAPSVPLTCPVCSETFTSAALLQNHHKAQHSKVKPFQCNLCSKTFSQGAGLSQHLKIHSGVRPYACQVCHKSFTQKGGLDQHARTHSPRRPYACVVCARGFRQSAHLSQHMRTHTRLQPFRCGLCERSFKQSTHLNFHLRTHHSQAD